MVYRFSHTDRERIEEVRKYLSSHLDEALRMARLCAISIMGRQKLNEGFKKLYGKPLSAIVLDMRMEKARQLLIDTDESIERIATATGYQHRSSFTRAYKKYYGHNPGLERRKDL